MNFTCWTSRLSRTQFNVKMNICVFTLAIWRRKLSSKWPIVLAWLVACSWGSIHSFEKWNQAIPKNEPIVSSSFSVTCCVVFLKLQLFHVLIVQLMNERVSDYGCKDIPNFSWRLLSFQIRQFWCLVYTFKQKTV